MVKIIDYGFKVYDDIEGDKGLDILRKIEYCGRTCYKSVNKNGLEDTKRFVGNLIKNGHTSVLEHQSITVEFTADVGFYKDLTRHRAGTAFSIESTRWCVAGNTKLKFINPHNRYSIEELYNKMLTSKNGSWKRLEIRQVNENTGLVDKTIIKNIFYNGEKETYKIKTKLGYELECTKDHKIYTPKGYIELQNLKVGDKIYVNGKEVTKPLYQDYDWLYHQSITLNKTFVDIAKEFGFNVSTLKDWRRKLNIPSKGTGYFNKGKIPWNKNLKESDDVRVNKQANALRKYHHSGIYDNEVIKKTDTSEYQKYNTGICAVCRKEKDIEVHHIDHNRKNNNPQNLISVCESCHQRIHKKSLLQIFGDEIVSIEYVGKQKVYDIEVDSEFHNYNANGIIVHNCNYSKDKFGGEIQVMNPFFMNDLQRDIWEDSMLSMEKYYKELGEADATNDIKRMILPHSTKATVMMTANLRAWRHILNIRTKKNVHPSISRLLTSLLVYFQANIPVVFDDIISEVEPLDLGDRKCEKIA